MPCISTKTISMSFQVTIPGILILWLINWYSDCEISKTTAFSICNNCEHVKEIKNTKLSKYFSNFEDNSGMKYKKYNLEFFGLCRDCKLKQ